MDVALSRWLMSYRWTVSEVMRLGDTGNRMILHLHSNARRKIVPIYSVKSFRNVDVIHWKMRQTSRFHFVKQLQVYHTSGFCWRHLHGTNQFGPNFSFEAPSVINVTHLPMPFICCLTCTVCQQWPHYVTWQEEISLPYFIRPIHHIWHDQSQNFDRPPQTTPWPVWYCPWLVQILSHLQVR